MEKKDERLRNKNLFESFKNAINGIIYGVKTQVNLKIQLAVCVIVIVFSVIFKLSNTEFLFVIFACSFVIFAEMVNTAIETLVDLKVQKYHPKAKIAKDVAAGAVVIASLNAIVVAYFIFFNKIFI